VGIVAKDGFQPTLDRDDPFELQGVLRHRLTVAIGINDDLLGRWWCQYAHQTGPRMASSARFSGTAGVRGALEKPSLHPCRCVYRRGFVGRLQPQQTEVREA